MKRTPLFDCHLALGARMVPFGGYEMPVQYKGVIAEHTAVRENVGIFDVSHMGEFLIKGEDALSFLQDVTTNDVSSLAVGQAQYSTMCLSTGGIIDDLLLYRHSDYFLMVVNAANIKKDYEWLQSNSGGNLVLENISDHIALVAVQGPTSRDIISSVFGIDLSGLAYYHFINSQLFGKDVLISRTGYTGELGFEIYSDSDIAANIWQELFTKGETFHPMPVGLAARDTLRLEMRYCLYGNDISEETNPIEAGLGWITKLDKGPFIGSSAIASIKEEKPKKRLISFSMNERAIPRPGHSILIDDKRVGEVTSGSYSPTLQKGIGLGYIATEFSKVGTIIDIEIRGQGTEAMIIKPPFVPETSLMG